MYESLKAAPQGGEVGSNLLAFLHFDSEADALENLKALTDSFLKTKFKIQ